MESTEVGRLLPDFVRGSGSAPSVEVAQFASGSLSAPVCELSPDPIFVVLVPGLAYPVPLRICFRVFLPSEKYLNLVRILF